MVETETNQELSHNNSNKKVVWIISISIALIVIAGLVWFLSKDKSSSETIFSGKGETGQYVVYLKDDKVLVKQNGSQDKATVLFSVINDYFQLETMKTLDKLIVFPDQFDELETSYTLSYVNIEQLEDKQKIDSGVNDFFINEKGTQIVYTKNNNQSNDLYLYNFKESVKLDSNIQYILDADPAGKLVIYYKDDALYQWELQGSKGPEKIDDNSIFIESNGDLTKIYYTKDRELYLKEAGKASVKLIDEFDSLIQVKDNGSMYYLVTEVNEIPLSHYVNDDYASEDSSIKEPDESDYYVIQEYTDWWGDTYEYEEFDWNGYEYAYDRYEEKLERDQLRAELQNNTVTQVNNILYYFDGKQSTKITDKFAHFTSVTNQDTAPILTYYKQIVSALDKKNLSELYTVDDIVYDTYNLVETDYENNYIALADQEIQYDNDEMRYFTLSPAGDSIYFVRYFDEGKSKIVKLPIANNKLEQEITVTENEKGYLYFGFHQNKLLQFSNVRKMETNYDFKEFAELYIDGQYIDDRVDPDNYRIDPEDKSMLYFTGYSAFSQSGALFQYKENKSTKVADDVHNYIKHNANEFAYISNYDINKRYGDLYYRTAGKETAYLIDEQVTTVISVLD